jgi:hypothetical protein
MDTKAIDEFVNDHHTAECAIYDTGICTCNRDQAAAELEALKAELADLKIVCDSAGINIQYQEDANKNLRSQLADKERVIEEVISDLEMYATILLSDGEQERGYRLRNIANKLRPANPKDGEK